MQPELIIPERVREDGVVGGSLSGVYGYMALGLLATTVVAFFVSGNAQILSLLYSNIALFYLLFIVEIGIVWYLSARVHTLAPATATALFFLYAILNGVTLSVIFLIYQIGSIAGAFLAATGTFGVMALYGATTKRDLTSVGSFAVMGLFGLVIASLVNLFLRSSGADFLLSIVAVLIFTVLTAYDAQKIRQMRMAPIVGALALYLDFINLFLNILRLGGRRK